MHLNCTCNVYHASYFVKIIGYSRWFCKPPPSFGAVYRLICGRRKVAVAGYRIICLVQKILREKKQLISGKI